MLCHKTGVDMYVFRFLYFYTYDTYIIKMNHNKMNKYKKMLNYVLNRYIVFYDNFDMKFAGK